MYLTARSLLDHTIATEDGDCPVRELFYSPEDRGLRYLLIDTGGWFHSDEVLVSADRISRDENDGWRLNMSHDELDDAPVIDSLEPGLTTLPPLVVGPFGYTFSPLAMAASIESATQTPGVGHADHPVADGGASTDGSGRILRMRRVTQLLGCEAFTDAGRQGEITDVQMSDELTLTHAVLNDGTKLSLRNLRRVADQGHALFS